ncbi:trypsin-like peptidase domain-containing protein [Albirhodobacter sp. R86504]|uniref:trypsin-like peptidase domain-containing protein n=1 Tax=Albirhodobacter sp. R86504 TaxID=3093848 RepID=UPI003672D2CC
MNSTRFATAFSTARFGIAGLVSATALTLIFAQSASAEPMWLQIEANSSLSESQQAARQWAETLPDISGFAMTTGMYAIAIGPFETREDADAQRLLLRGERVIPADSYITDGTRYVQQYWPIGAQLTRAPAETPSPASPEADLPETTAVDAPAPTNDLPPALPEETAAEARASERALNTQQRMDLQEALAWQGFYTAGIDGAFGAGTRRSMAAWQAATGAEETGILTTAQRADLLTEVSLERASLGLQTVRDDEAGIEIDLPLGLVEFGSYSAPFANYTAKDGSGVQVLLISQGGDQGRLFGLYDIMQTLEIVPLEGPRERDRSGFTLIGSNAEMTSYTQVKLQGGLIKGFTLAYPTAKAPQMERVLSAMKDSFTAVGNTAMDDTLGQPLGVAKADLLSGLDVRRPVFDRSGFYIDAKGSVLTASAGLDQCSRVTVDNTEADIALNDASGVAVLTPKAALAPKMIAAFQSGTPRMDADIAAAGFSYGGALSSPVVSFGRFSAAEGLEGEPSQSRLALRTRDGDAGGPVLDASGGVIGLILPSTTARTETAQILPDDLSVALQSATIAPVLTQAGYAPAAAETAGSLAAEDLSLIARAITVPVSCWK